MIPDMLICLFRSDTANDRPDQGQLYLNKSSCSYPYSGNSVSLLLQEIANSLRLLEELCIDFPFLNLFLFIRTISLESELMKVSDEGYSCRSLHSGHAIVDVFRLKLHYYMTRLFLETCTAHGGSKGTKVNNCSIGRTFGIK